MNTLAEILASRTVEQLKALLALLPDAPRAVRKDEVVQAILTNFASDRLRALWDRLDDTQRLAVAEGTHDPEGMYNEDRFLAKYGRLPDFTLEQDEKERRYGMTSGRPTLLRLFLHWEDGCYRLPSDIRERLETFVPEPDPFRLNTVEALPERRGKDRLTVRYGEQEAMVDLPVLLRLADAGSIQVSDKTSAATASSLRLLTEKLPGGDFYPYRPRQNQWDQEIGPIKAVAWPLLLQAGGLLQRQGSKLALSKAGLNALRAPPAGVLRTLWKKWLKSTLLDEFSRVDAIKGQKAKGPVMTAVAPRRGIIESALQCCPVGAWIDVDEFSRFMQAENYTFEVTRNPWKLYLSEQRYGTLGYDGSHDWSILQLRYLLCLLFEYAAPLGIVDVAYVDPEGARPDFGGLWGSDELAFLSRYDGLMYFRLTPLGAYCLELSEAYTPARIQSAARISVLPGLQLNVVNGHLSPEETLTLDAWAQQQTDGIWRLDDQKALAAVEKGHDIEELRAFLQARDDQPLPETVESFISACRRRGSALKVCAMALLIECQDADTAARIAAHKDTAALCLRAGERHLVVRLEHKEKFHRLVRELGFGMTNA